MSQIYKEAQKFVGGMVEGITFPNGDYLIINEEGKLINLPLNPEATALWRRHLQKISMFWYVKTLLLVLQSTIKKDALKILGSITFDPGANAPRGPKPNPKIQIKLDPIPPFCKKGSHYSRLYCMF